MTEEELTLARFGELLDAYGADFERWPEPTRQPARRLAARDAKATALLQGARELDAALDSWQTQEPSAALQRRVAEIPLRHPRQAAAPALPWLLGAFWRTAFSGALVLTLGFGAGMWSGEPTDEDGGTVIMASVDTSAAADTQADAADDADSAELDAWMQLAFLDEVAEEDWP